jgi:hypothetical protein
VKEKWKDIPGFENRFSVSDKGRVISKPQRIRFLSKAGGEHHRHKQAKILATQILNSGYEVVHLNVDGVRTARTVHSLVANAFLGACPVGMEVCHFDGNKRNNVLTNLRYDTRRANREDARRHGSLAVGERIAQSKLKPADVLKIRASRKSAVETANAFGVSRGQVNRIWRGDAWRHV